MGASKEGKMKITPTKGKIFCEIISDREVSTGGIIMATTIKEAPKRARVISIGEPKPDEKGKLPVINFKQGDIVFFKKNFGVKCTIDGKPCIFLKMEEITGVLEDDRKMPGS